MRAHNGSDTVTQGIRVQVMPQYLEAESDPDAGRFIFAYHVVITNEGRETAKLCSRHWMIVDAEGERRDVHGLGVVGHMPVLEPGEFFEYTSYCPVPTPWGTMEGTYLMEREDGSLLEVRIGRFYLVAPQHAMSNVLTTM